MTETVGGPEAREVSPARSASERIRSKRMNGLNKTFIFNGIGLFTVGPLIPMFLVMSAPIGLSLSAGAATLYFLVQTIRGVYKMEA